MACTSLLRTVMRTQPWQSLSHSRNTISLIGWRASGKFNFSKEFHSTKQQKCCDKETPILSMLCNNDSPQEFVIKSISEIGIELNWKAREVSKTEGSIDPARNVIIGDKVPYRSSDEWLALDQAVNTYPMVRGFTAIGSGGEDFIQSMIVAVESVVQQPIPKCLVRQKVSSKGKYISVHIGPINVVSREQVQAVYNAMRRDDRMKYFL